MRVILLLHIHGLMVCEHQMHSIKLWIGHTKIQPIQFRRQFVTIFHINSKSFKYYQIAWNTVNRSCFSGKFQILWLSAHCYCKVIEPKWTEPNVSNSMNFPDHLQFEKISLFLSHKHTYTQFDLFRIRYGLMIAFNKIEQKMKCARHRSPEPIFTISLWNHFSFGLYDSGKEVKMLLWQPIFHLEIKNVFANMLTLLLRN